MTTTAQWVHALLIGTLVPAAGGFASRALACAAHHRAAQAWGARRADAGAQSLAMSGPAAWAAWGMRAGATVAYQWLSWGHASSLIAVVQAATLLLTMTDIHRALGLTTAARATAWLAQGLPGALCLCSLTAASAVATTSPDLILGTLVLATTLLATSSRASSLVAPAWRPAAGSTSQVTAAAPTGPNPAASAAAPLLALPGRVIDNIVPTGNPADLDDEAAHWVSTLPMGADTPMAVVAARMPHTLDIITAHRARHLCQSPR